MSKPFFFFTIFPRNCGKENRHIVRRFPQYIFLSFAIQKRWWNHRADWSNYHAKSCLGTSEIFFLKIIHEKTFGFWGW